MPAKGFSGTRALLEKAAGVIAARSYDQIFSAGSANWSASRPKPGMLAVQPNPDGMKSPIVTLMASPGSAPSIRIGPTTGLIRPKSSAATSATVLVGVSWPSDESGQSTLTVSPGATVNIGGIALSQPK